jgi:hypothetical protein
MRITVSALATEATVGVATNCAWQFQREIDFTMHSKSTFSLFGAFMVTNPRPLFVPVRHEYFLGNLPHRMADAFTAALDDKLPPGNALGFAWSLMVLAS